LTAPPAPPRPPLRDVIARHGLTASKALGQNFLLDSQLLDKIARIPGPLAGAAVYEVGPGPGGLTRALLDRGATVTVIERDRRCLPALAELSDSAPGRLHVIEGDALMQNLETVIPPGGHVVANLPYNIGTALLVNWLSGPLWPPRWASLTLMFQQEVAERIVAATNSDAYGRLAILSQWRSTPVIALRVHRSAFTPPPKVMSAVIHIIPKSAPDGVDPRLLERLTAAAFGQRRKMLRQSLKSLPGALPALSGLNIDPSRRAETLSIDEFTAIARALSVARD
jgi:16S rRNA (adenine1518-N6/adenine1519-N6)-dimethyltransferase